MSLRMLSAACSGVVPTEFDAEIRENLDDLRIARDRLQRLGEPVLTSAGTPPVTA